MKVTVKQQSQEFEEITLEITLSDRKELEHFHQICRFAPSDFSNVTKDILKDKKIDIDKVNDIAIEINNITYDFLYLRN